MNLGINISYQKLVSLFFLLATIVISLALSSVSFLKNDRGSKLPKVSEGYEGYIEEKQGYANYEGYEEEQEGYEEEKEGYEEEKEEGYANYEGYEEEEKEGYEEGMYGYEEDAEGYEQEGYPNSSPMAGRPVPYSNRSAAVLSSPSYGDVFNNLFSLNKEGVETFDTISSF